MEQKRLDLYTFSEHQLILLNTCINAWRGSTFWALMYMQSRLFHAENVDSIYRELQAQPAQYDQIMERYYGIQLITGTAAAGSPLYRYYAAYLDALDARQRSQAERIRCQWLDLNRLTAARLSALNPHWDASLWSSMFIHNTTLLCDAADQDLLGNYHAISASYLLLDQLACEMGEYMSVGSSGSFISPSPRAARTLSRLHRGGRSPRRRCRATASAARPEGPPPLPRRPGVQSPPG